MCVLLPLLFSLITNDNMSWDPYVDNTTVDGLIQNSDALAYLVERLAGCCSENDLELNTCKARVFDFFTTHVITSSKKFKYFNFISTAISIDLNWDKNVSAAINKADGKYFESKPDVLTPFCSQTLNNSDRLKPRKRSCIPLFTVMSYGVYAQKELHPSLHSDVIWCLCSKGVASLSSQWCHMVFML